MSNLKWTGQQKAAIEACGAKTVVSAAAGSGKTAVLVERLIKGVTDLGNPIDIDRYLVVSFTNAAAGGVKRKLSEAIYQRMSGKPDDRRLERQLALLESADISTITAFCLKLVKRYFYLLDLPSEFSVGDAAVIARLEDETAADLMNEMYERGGGEFRETVAYFSGYRSEDGFLKAAEKLSAILESTPMRGRFLEELKQNYKTAAQSDPFDGFMGGYIKKDCLDLARKIKALAGDTAGRFADDGVVGTYFGNIEQFAGEVRELIESGASYAETRETVIGFDKGRLRTKELPQEQERLLARRKKELNAALGELAEYFEQDPQSYRREIGVQSRMTAALADFVAEYEARLFSKKTERGLLAFSDIEQLAFQLLVDDFDRETGAITKSAVAAEISERYHEILIDEYQDSNMLQDCIFRAISRGEKNLFVVGDVKQSIYRFRSSNPDIFNRLLETKDGSVKRIPLNKNFRSGSAVVDFCNFVFGGVMSKKLGEIEYDENERLTCGVDFKGRVTLNVVTGDASEAAAAARRIRELIDGSGGTVKPGDIAILLRKFSGAEQFARELRRLGVECDYEGGGFFARSEVSAAVSFLKAIDNPLDDVRLLGALRSELWDFTDKQLAEIRAVKKDVPFYEALLACGSEKARGFALAFEKYRLLSENLPVPELLLQIFSDTGFKEKLEASQNGAARARRATGLYDLAGEFEKSGGGGLYEFLNYLDWLEKTGAEGVFAGADSGDCVKIMTVHHSKGLEFPIVFVCGLSSRFNTTDSTDAAIAHRDFGLVFKHKDEQLGARFMPVTYRAAKNIVKREQLSEEMRCLYVALTRAQKELHLFCSVKRKPKSAGLYAIAPIGFSDKAVYVEDLLKASCFSAWILNAAATLPRCAALRELLGTPRDEQLEYGGGPAFSVNVVERDEIGLAKTNDRKEEVRVDLEQLRARFEYKYPYSFAQGLPAKVAVSELKRIALEKTPALKSAVLVRPEFLGPQGDAGAAQRGSALHKYMQFCRFDLISQEGGAAAELERLVAEEFLTEGEARLVDIASAAAFGKSELAQRIMRSGRVVREHRFAARLTKEDFDRLRGYLDYEVQDESVIVQGVIDCAFEENGGYVLVDYKTDRVRSGEDELREKYGLQLVLYRRCLENILEADVKKTLIYSFDLEKTVEIA